MNTLEELEYYCGECNPVGALMLTGEWGCGKTYLIDEILTPKLAEKNIFIRISLFGIGSVEELKNEIKRNWLYTLAKENKPLSGFTEIARKYGSKAKKYARKGKNFLPEPLKTIASGVLSLDALDFVEVEPEIGNKRVILVFDDLERANISTGDLLGCINDYCENSHINTIVVANEEKIKSKENTKIEYREIKEKIIQRTVRYMPDFPSIVTAVINDIADDNPKYKKFLFEQKEEIITIFSGKTADGMSLDEMISRDVSKKSTDDIEGESEKIADLLRRRPHNIRSLKCALKDFKRVLHQLEEKKIDHKEQWLFSFVTYVLSFRAELVSESDRYGRLFSHKKVSTLYPGFFDARYITDGIEHWICYGEWDKETINSELEYILERDRAITPEEKVRTYRLLEIDEQDLQVGYPLFLEKAYNGEISLDDYVHFLWNRCWGREYEIPLPDVEWLKIYNGIEKKINELISKGEEQPRHRSIIGEKNKSYFLPEEWTAYEKIRDFLDNKILIFEKNRKEYMDVISSASDNVFIQIRDKCYDRFDEEMAEATAKGFESASNIVKNQFVNSFKDMWQVKIWSQDYRIEAVENGFPKLKEELQRLLEMYSQKNMAISMTHTKRFLSVVSELCVEQEKRRKKSEE